MPIAMLCHVAVVVAVAIRRAFLASPSPPGSTLERTLLKIAKPSPSQFLHRPPIRCAGCFSRLSEPIQSLRSSHFVILSHPRSPRIIIALARTALCEGENVALLQLAGLRAILLSSWSWGGGCRQIKKPLRANQESCRVGKASILPNSLLRFVPGAAQ
jgi:hypothetical protein